MTKRTLLVALIALAGTGCTGRFLYRGADYELPEEAISAQREFHQRELLGVTPVLAEQRQPGRCRVVIPTETGARRVLGDAASNDVAMEFYRASSRVEELRSLGQSLERAALFGAVAVTQELFPNSALPSGDDWLVTCRFSDDGARLGWYLTRGTRRGAPIAFSLEDEQAPDRLDRFVAAATTAVRTVAAQPDGQVANPVHALWWKGEVDGVSVFFPLPPRREDLPRGAGARARARLSVTYDDVLYESHIVRLSPDHVVEAGVLDGWRDELVSSTILGGRPQVVKEVDGRSDDGFAYKLIGLTVPSEYGADKVAVAFVTVGRRTFYWGLVAGTEKALADEQGARRPDGVQPFALDPKALAFLSSVQLADEPPVSAAGGTFEENLRRSLQEQFPGARVEVSVRQGQ